LLLAEVGEDMDLRKLKTLIDLVSESNVSELEITEAEGKVRIVKGGGALAQQAYMPMPVQGAAAVAPTSAPGAAVAAPAPAVPAGHLVKSPMVARFTVHPRRAESHLLKLGLKSSRATPFASLKQ
jgi:biotin carboxyl carrier protein